MNAVCQACLTVKSWGRTASVTKCSVSKPTTLEFYRKRFVAELARDGADRYGGERARARVYGEVVDPLLTQGADIKHVTLRS